MKSAIPKETMCNDIYLAFLKLNTEIYHGMILSIVYSLSYEIKLLILDYLFLNL